MSSQHPPLSDQPGFVSIERISGRERGKLTFFVWLTFLLYYPLNAYSSTLAPNTPILPIDELLPFSPDWVFVYFFIYFLGIMPVAVVANRIVFWRVVYSFLVVELVSFTAFVVYPVEMTLRATDLPAETFAGWALTMCYSIDRPFNCFPSLHVGYATVGALCTWKVDKLVGTLGLIAAALISLSTMLVKQHFFVDVVGGFALAVIVYGIFLAPVKLPAADPAVFRLDRKWVVTLLLLYSSLVAGGYFMFMMGWQPWVR